MNEINEKNEENNIINSSLNNKHFINTPIGNESISSNNNIQNEILYFSVNQDSK